MNGVDLQEVLALGVVALVVGLALWRRSKRRTKAAGSCGNCDAPAAKSKEATLRFYRRKP